MGVDTVKKIKSKTSVQTLINAFLDIRKENSLNTLDNYRRSIDEFFEITLNKNINNVTWEDLEGLEFGDIIQYKEELLRRSLLYTTIKTKFSPVTSLFEGYICTQNSKVKNIFRLDLPKENLTESRKRSYGALTHEEVLNLIEFADNISYKGKMQGLFFKTLYITAIRHKALLALKKEDLHVRKDITGKYIKTIEIRHKGSDIVKPIADNLYLELKQISNKRLDVVFNISDGRIQKTFNEFKEHYKIEEDRNIVIHSIKKASLDRVVGLTGDIAKGAEQGDHKSLDTTRNYYLGKNKSLTENPSYNLFNDLNRTYKIEDLKDCTSDELLRLIEKLGKETLIKLIKIKEDGEDEATWNY